MHCFFTTLGTLVLFTCLFDRQREREKSHKVKNTTRIHVEYEYQRHAAFWLTDCKEYAEEVGCRSAVKQFFREYILWELMQ